MRDVRELTLMLDTRAGRKTLLNCSGVSLCSLKVVFTDLFSQAIQGYESAISQFFCYLMSLISQTTFPVSAIDSSL